MAEPVKTTDSAKTRAVETLLADSEDELDTLKGKLATEQQVVLEMRKQVSRHASIEARLKAALIGVVLEWVESNTPHTPAIDHARTVLKELDEVAAAR